MGLALPLELEGKEMNHYYVEDEEKHYPEGLPGLPCVIQRSVAQPDLAAIHWPCGLEPQCDKHHQVWPLS